MLISLAAIMASVVSSPTFSNILLIPLWYKLATYELSGLAFLRPINTSSNAVKISADVVGDCIGLLVCVAWLASGECSGIGLALSP